MAACLAHPPAQVHYDLCVNGAAVAQGMLDVLAFAKHMRPARSPQLLQNMQQIKQQAGQAEAYVSGQKGAHHLLEQTGCARIMQKRPFREIGTGSAALRR